MNQLETQQLQNRIAEFYELLKQREWEQCFTYIDPVLRDEGKVTLDAYSRTMSSFFATHGPLGNVSVQDLKLHLGQQSKLYENRDFALGDVVVQDREQRPYRLKERWVKAADGHWYTRMVGLV